METVLVLPVRFTTLRFTAASPPRRGSTCSPTWRECRRSSTQGLAAKVARIKASRTPARSVYPLQYGLAANPPADCCGSWESVTNATVTRDRVAVRRRLVFNARTLGRSGGGCGRLSKTGDERSETLLLTQRQPPTIGGSAQGGSPSRDDGARHTAVRRFTRASPWWCKNERKWRPRSAADPPDHRRCIHCGHCCHFHWSTRRSLCAREGCSCGGFGG
jgi:hypothetical protein